MRKIIIVIFSVSIFLGIGTFYLYQHYYVKTLMLSEIIEDTGENKIDILINLFDFDTGLTRHDINRLKNSKDYWINRMHEVEQIDDPYIKQIENEKLIAEMLEDPTMKKLVKGILSTGFNLAFSILEVII